MADNQTPQAQYELPEGTGNNPQEDYNQNFEQADHAGGWLTAEIATGEGGVEGEWYTFDNSGKAKKAQADSFTNCSLVFMLTEDAIAGAEGTFLKAGNWVKSGWGGDPSKIYYLDQSTPGAWTTTQPASGLIIVLGRFDEDTETFHIAEGGGGGGGAGTDHASLLNLELASSGHTLTQKWSIPVYTDAGTMFEFINNTLDTGNSYIGYSQIITKTNGTTGTGDTMKGAYNSFAYDDSSNTIGTLYGTHNFFSIKNGAQVGNNNLALIGTFNQFTVEAGGTAWGQVIGTYNYLTVENTGEVDNHAVYGTKTLIYPEGQGVGGSGAQIYGDYIFVNDNGTGDWYSVNGVYRYIRTAGSITTGVFGNDTLMTDNGTGTIGSAVMGMRYIFAYTGTVTSNLFGTYLDNTSTGVSGMEFAHYVTGNWDYALYVNGTIPIYIDGGTITPDAVEDYLIFADKGIYIADEGFMIGSSTSAWVDYPNRLVTTFYSGNVTEGGGGVWVHKHYYNISGGTHSSSSYVIGIENEIKLADAGATGANAFGRFYGVWNKPTVENCEIRTGQDFVGYYNRPSLSNAELIGGDYIGFYNEASTYNETVTGDLFGAVFEGYRAGTIGSVSGTSYVLYVTQENTSQDWDYLFYCASNIPSFFAGDLSAGQHDAGTNSEAFGAGASATADDAVALGNGAVASGDYSVALGTDSSASGGEGITVGYGSTNSGIDSLVIGANLSLTENNSILIGDGAVAGGDASMVIGVDASGGGYQNVTAIGITATASGQNSVVVGYNTDAGESGISIGNGADGNSGNNNIVIGAGANTTGTGAGIAIGGGATADLRAIAIGRSASAGYEESIALGYGATTTQTNEMVVGATTYEIDDLQFVVSGTYLTWTNSVRVVGNLSCRPAGTGAGTEIFGSGSSCTAGGGTIVGADITVTGDQPTLVGHNVTASGKTVGIGYEANVGSQSVAVGYQVDAGNDSVYIGYQATDGSGGGWSAVVIGHGAQAINGGQNTIIGYSASQNGARGVIIGKGASSNYDDCIVLGVNATGTQDNEMLVGATTYEIDTLKFIVSGTQLNFDNTVYFTGDIGIDAGQELVFDATGVHDAKIKANAGGPHILEFYGGSGGNKAFEITTDLGTLGDKVLFTADIECINLMDTGAGVFRKLNRYTSTQTLDLTNHIVFCDTDGGTFTINLPAGLDGQEYKIVNTGSSGNAVTISPNGTENLFGSNSNYSLTDGNAIIIHWDSTEGWF